MSLKDRSSGPSTGTLPTPLQEGSSSVERCRLAPPAGSDLAHRLLGRTVYPRIFRALLGVEAPREEESDEASLAADVDLAPIRDAVTALVPSGEVGAP
jgi:hypothetical protein